MKVPHRLYCVFKGAMEIIEATYEGSSQIITCTSRGGPASSVTWSLNHSPILVDGSTYQASQIVLDTSTATYQNRLTIVAKSREVSGKYTCVVRNARGSATASLSISGKAIYYIVEPHN